jgi:hypothetical protein
METLAAGHRSSLWANSKRDVIALFLIFSIIAFLVIVGNAWLLLRVARWRFSPPSAGAKP